MAHHIKNILAVFMHQSNDWRIMLLRNWSDILGTLSQHVQLEKIEHDTLVLCVQDACWLHEVYMLSPVLLATINQKLDQPYVKRLRFKQMSTPKNRQKIFRKHTMSQIIAPYPLSPHEQKALSSIDDPLLRNALEQFLHRCRRERV